LLEEWGCDLYQGFLGAAPLDEGEIARFVTASARDAA
jgi:EAL domain-containing protein (putative c-di-GMP-specific phosphodiesterase class I)